MYIIGVSPSRHGCFNSKSRSNDLDDLVKISQKHIVYLVGHGDIIGIYSHISIYIYVH